MLVNNLFIHPQLLTFFWLQTNTGRFVQVTEYNYSQGNKSVVEKIVKEILLPPKFLNVIDFEMENSGSELVAFIIKYNNSESIEVLIFQESDDKLKLLTPFSNKLLQLSKSSIEIDVEYPIFINHYSLNLRLISQNNLKNIYIVLHYLLNNKSFSVEEFSHAILSDFKTDDMKTLDNSSYKEQLEKHDFKQPGVKEKTYTDDDMMKILDNSSYKEQLKRYSRVQYNLKQPFYHNLSDEEEMKKIYTDEDVLNWLRSKTVIKKHEFTPDLIELSKLGIPPATGASTFDEYIRNYKNLLILDSNLRGMSPDEIIEMLITRMGSEGKSDKEKDEEVIFKRLIVDALAYNININQNKDQIVKDLSKLMPTQWIIQSRNSNSPHDYFDRYTTDEWMGILSYLYERKIQGMSEDLSRDDIVSFINNLNKQIYAHPRTIEEFKVFEGFNITKHNLNILDLDVGDIIVMNVQESGTFSVDVATEYIDYNNVDWSLHDRQRERQEGENIFREKKIDDVYNACCLAEIIIPPGMVLAYHPSEDQVIFPIGAQYKIISKLAYDFPPFKIKSYRMLYLSSPVIPITYNSFSDIPKEKVTIIKK